MERRQLLLGSARSGRCCNRSTTKGCAQDPRAPSLLPHPPFSYVPSQARKLSETSKKEPQRAEGRRKRRTKRRTNGETQALFWGGVGVNSYVSPDPVDRRIEA